jgi:hypothetical protein
VSWAWSTVIEALAPSLPDVPSGIALLAGTGPVRPLQFAKVATRAGRALAVW